MKKSMLLLPALALVLASCTDPTPIVDPLTLSFKGTGTATYKPTTPVTLFDYSVDDKEINIGTLNTDGTVNITVTPDTVKALSMQPIQKFGVGSCTGEPTSPNGMTYVYLNRVYLKGSSPLAYIAPNTLETTADGVRHHVQNLYLYANMAGNIKATFKCTDFNGPVGYDLNLKAGWNHLQLSYTYDPSTKKFANFKEVVVDQSNTYNGPWRYIP